MAILITSPGLVTTGTEGADEILFGSSVAANGSVVNALAGNDTIQLTAAGSTISAVGGPTLNGMGGADVIGVSALPD